MTPAAKLAVVERDARTDASDTIPVENPATGQIVGHVPAMTAADVAECADAGAPRSRRGKRSATTVARASFGACKSGSSTTPIG